MKKGFTLVELLVVIAIISLLASIVLSSIRTSQTEGSDTAKIRALQEVRSALELYRTSNGGYPGGSSSTLASFLVPKYISSVDANLLYQGTDSSNQNTCATAPCVSYHLGIPLSLTNNKVLLIDKDINVGFDGTKDNCISGTASVPDLCYDIVP